MLQLIIPAIEQWDEERCEFIKTREYKLQLEHSLVSLSKWESKWCKPFLTKEEKSIEKTLDYIRCMTITQNVDQEVYKGITNANINQVNDYIEAPMTATWFSKDNNGGKINNEQITAELIYYWMIGLNIPIECQKWHLNRLLALVRVCNIKNQPPKKISQREIMERNTALNEARKKQLNTTG